MTNEPRFPIFKSFCGKSLASQLWNLRPSVQNIFHESSNKTNLPHFQMVSVQTVLARFLQFLRSILNFLRHKTSALRQPTHNPDVIRHKRRLEDGLALSIKVGKPNKNMIDIVQLFICNFFREPC